jgi:hypothetical protein
MIISTPMQEQPLQTGGTSYAFYQHIVDLPLNKFIEASTSGNLSALIISGTPPEEDLYNAWGTIMEEYSLAIGDHETRLRFNLYTEINKLQLKINQIALIVSILKNYYVPIFVTELNNLLVTTMVFDINKPDEYDKKLQLALNRSKGYKIQLDLKIDHYEALSKSEGSGAVTKEYFQSVLITISNHAKYLIPDTITVFEFCERIKRFNREAEQKNK